MFVALWACFRPLLREFCVGYDCWLVVLSEFVSFGLWVWLVGDFVVVGLVGCAGC